MNWFKDHASEFSGQLLFDEPLKKHTYYRIGGPAEVLAVPKAVGDLEWLARGISESGVPYFILGAGSNLLASDAGYRGLVIKTSRIDLEISAQGERLRTGGSVAVSTLLRRAAQEGWGGLEFLTGIPGLIGGVVAMNGGTHLGEAKDALQAVSAFDLNSGEQLGFDHGQLRFEYRGNLFLPSGAIVTSAEWKIIPGESAKVKAMIDETLARRKATQPLDHPSCGSVFKNPREKGLHAWQVVDQLGLRGYRIGGAQFAEKHSNFIVNLGDATAADVKGLIDLAKSRALKELGVALEEEVKYLVSR